MKITKKRDFFVETIDKKWGTSYNILTSTWLTVMEKETVNYEIYRYCKKS